MRMVSQMQMHGRINCQLFQDYISQAGNIAQLHTQISSCDGILGRMENLLLSFQTDLGSISCEILNLQQESVEMNLRLKNRQSV